MTTASQVLSAGTSRENWIPLLQCAALEVFQLMLTSTLTTAEEAVDPAVLDVTSIVGLTGKLSGTATVRCASESGILMASKMLGVDLAEAGPHLRDAMGEICNLVAGNFKNKIPGLSDGCMLSVPTVITGPNYVLHLSPKMQSFHNILLFDGSPVVFSLHASP